ncbi:MAG TPA: DNA gyrase inhibitor YacG [Paracoccaceae bacterium]|nr:DNA gyrase inhibitor YacG [Paracoccaceae bacterium]
MPGGACPVCGKLAAPAYRPFCSRRCADVDLGRWLGGHYRLPGPPAEGDEAPQAEGER